MISFLKKSSQKKSSRKKSSQKKNLFERCHFVLGFFQTIWISLASWDSRIPGKIRISWVKLEREREGRNSRNLFSLSGRRLCYLFKPSTGVNQMTRTSHNNNCFDWMWIVCYSFLHSCWCRICNTIPTFHSFFLQSNQTTINKVFLVAPLIFSS